MSRPAALIGMLVLAALVAGTASAPAAQVAPESLAASSMKAPELGARSSLSLQVEVLEADAGRFLRGAPGPDPDVLALEPGRALWPYPVVGAFAGAVVGAGLSAVMMYRVDDWVAPPAFFVLVPAGAVVGGVIGLLVAPRDR